MSIIPIEKIQMNIIVLRGEKVILDFHLAKLYEVETKRLSEAVKRNVDRFPNDFMFQLDRAELKVIKTYFINQNLQLAEITNENEAKNINKIQGLANLKSQIATSSLQVGKITNENNLSTETLTDNFEWGGSRKLPYAFTEQGVAMLSSALNSPKAIAVNIEIVRAFVYFRKLISSNKELAKKISALEDKYDKNFKIVFDAIRELMDIKVTKNKKRIGF